MPAHLGQHFLKSPSAIEKIVAAGAIVPGECVLEIGPGRGVLTRALLAAGARVIAIEKDSALVAELNKTFAKEIAEKTLVLIEGDIRAFDAHILKANHYKLIANIPYYITGEIIRTFLESIHQPERAVVLIQKEVAERIVARDKKESILSLSVKAYGTPRMVATVKAGSFSPPPKVDSAILLIENISRDFFTGVSEEAFFTLMKAGFSQKRKQLATNLASVLGLPREEIEHVFARVGLSHHVRAEDVSLQEWKAVGSYFAH